MIRTPFLIFLLGAVQLVQGQDTLGLERAIEIGLRKNFDIHIEMLNIDIAENNNDWGQAGRYPLITFLSNQNNTVIQRQPANPFAVPGRNLSDNLTGQLDAQFTLFNGFAVRFTKQRLEQLEKLSYGNASFVLENVVQSIILSYYQALLEKERLRVLQKVTAFSKERYDYVKLRKELGGAITFDVLNEQNNYLTDSANVLRQEIIYRNALRNLNLLINDDVKRTYALTDSLVFQDEVYDYEALYERMTRSNVNLRNQFINQEILRNEIKLQQSATYPLITLNVGATGSLDRLNAEFNTNTGGNTITTVGQVDVNGINYPVTNVVPERSLQRVTQTGHSYGAYANFGLRWTLFNGAQIKRSIENAQIQEKVGQASIEQLKMSLENDLLATFDLYNLRKKLVVISQTKFVAAELNLDLANERYRNGALSAIELRIVQENFQAAALETFEAIFDALASRTDLVRITGGFINQYPITRGTR